MRLTGSIGSGESLEGYLKTASPLSSTPQVVEDHDGNLSGFYISDDGIGINGPHDALQAAYIKALGSLGLSEALKIEDSNEDDLVSISDDGKTIFYIPEGNGNEDGFEIRDRQDPFNDTKRLKLQLTSSGDSELETGNNGSGGLLLDVKEFVLRGSADFKMQGGEFITSNSKVVAKMLEILDSGARKGGWQFSNSTSDQLRFSYNGGSANYKTVFLQELDGDFNQESSPSVDFEGYVANAFRSEIQAKANNQRLIAMLLDPTFTDNANTGVEHVGLELSQSDGIAINQVESTASLHFGASEIFMGNLPLVAGSAGTVYVDGGGFLKLA